MVMDIRTARVGDECIDMLSFLLSNSLAFSFLKARPLKERPPM